MSLSTLFNLLSTINRQKMAIGAVATKGCWLIDWHHSYLSLSELIPSREQNKDYSFKQCFRRKNAKLHSELDRGRYKTKLVVPR